MDESTYPAWICTECAEANGGNMPGDRLATWHLGVCGWCEQTKSVTEPRNFSYRLKQTAGEAT